MTKMTRSIFFVFFIFFISCSKNEIEKEEEGISINDVLPSLDLILSDGRVINDEELTDKVSLILLFNVECRDCQQQIPILKQVYNQVKNNDNVILFGISRAQGQAVVEEYWQRENITFPYSAQDDNTVYLKFAKSIVPRIYIADKDRIVRFTSTDNPLASYDDLLSIIESLN